MHYEESSLAELGLDEEDMVGASQNVGYLKWRWTTHLLCPPLEVNGNGLRTGAGYRYGRC